MFSQDTTADCVLRGKIENVRNLSQLLKCVSFKDTAMCFCSCNGLKVIVEDAKCVQASAFVGAEIFQGYQLLDELISFRFDLNVLMECLTIFDSPASGHSQQASSTALNLYYRGYGSPLRLVLIEDDIVTDCAIKTMEANEVLHFPTPGNNIFNKVVAHGISMKEIFNDLDPNSEYVDIFLSPEAPYFHLTTVSSSAKCTHTVPKESSVVEEFCCTDIAIFRYKFSQLKHALKPFQVCAKVSMNISDTGLLCFQFMVETESKQLCYIEFFCTAVVVDNED